MVAAVAEGQRGDGVLVAAHGQHRLTMISLFEVKYFDVVVDASSDHLVGLIIKAHGGLLVFHLVGLDVESVRMKNKTQ